jgi:ribonucleoside-diphosphate reductase beta chain
MDSTRDPVVRRLYDKAKELGTWDPDEIDLTRDAAQWAGLSDDERDFLVRVTWLFFGGEEAVARDLLPFALVVGNERRYDDELFVTAWLWEEGKHADFFRRFLDEVVGDDIVLDHREQQFERKLFDGQLGGAMRRLLADSSPGTQALALTTYCLLVEGVLADTGQRALEEALEARDLLPGLREGLHLVNRDEARHVAYGFHVLKRLVEEDAGVDGVVRGRVDELTPLVTRLADGIMLRYETRPFGLSHALREPLQRLVAQLERLSPAAA